MDLSKRVPGGRIVSRSVPKRPAASGRRCAGSCQTWRRISGVRWQRTASLMAVGVYGQALTLMEQVRDDLGDDVSAMNGPT